MSLSDANQIRPLFHCCEDTINRLAPLLEQHLPLMVSNPYLIQFHVHPQVVSHERPLIRRLIDDL